MKASDFTPFFGMHVLLQFKETIALAEASGSAVPTVAFGPHGMPMDAHGNELKKDDDPKRIAMKKTWPLRAVRAEKAPGESQGAPVFTYLLEGMVMPVTDGRSVERIVVSYIRGGSHIELCLDPEHILCCSVVRDYDVPGESSIIAKA